MLTSEYLAGYFDGDGSVQIAGNRASRSRYTLRCTITGTHKEVLLLIQGQWGGWVGTVAKANDGKNRKDAWRWVISGIRALPFLESIEPHLVIKKAQAMVGIAHQQRVDGVGFRGNELPDWELAIREAESLVLKEMKR